MRDGVLERIGIVLPVREEPAPAVLRLLEQISAEVPGVSVVLVDDSSEEHWLRFASSLDAFDGPARVHLIHRGPENRLGGLGGAVLLGFKELSGLGCTYAVCMDGDGQHPPTALVPIITKLSGDATLVLGSRYSQGGSAGEHFRGYRQAVSTGCTWAAKALFPRALRGCHDPMSGFFGVELRAVDLERTWTNGFKVLLQLMVQNRFIIDEVGFAFGERIDGESKGTLREGATYIKALLKLRFSRPDPLPLNFAGARIAPPTQRETPRMGDRFWAVSSATDE